jgi:uncharacterized metal-binding protein
MPSGRAHDLITIVLAAPAFAAGYAATHRVSIAVIVASSFIFGGLMFGPDLDTRSIQYSRWSILRGLWLPYRSVVKHRSRWSHGLLLGTFLRVLYFTGTLAVGGFVAATIIEIAGGFRIASFADFANMWTRLGELFSTYVGKSALVAAFVGVWSGAASHTASDIAVTFIKTGKVKKFL